MSDPAKIIATVCDEWDRGRLADYPSAEIGRRLNEAGWSVVRVDRAIPTFKDGQGDEWVHIVDEWRPVSGDQERSSG